MAFSRRMFLLVSTVPLLHQGTAHAAVQGTSAAALAPTLAPAHRGVNLSGAEFASDAVHLPGVADRDYRYPTQQDLRYVAGRGHRMVRLPIRWERIQPVLLGPLLPAELKRVLDVVDQAAAAGLKVLVDVHNYARYIRSASQGGATLVLGDGQLTDVHLVNLWARLSAALKGRAGVLGYGLMNEPHDLPGTAAAAAPSAVTEVSSTVASFDGGPDGWSGEGDTVTAGSSTTGTTHDGQGSLRVSRRMPAGRQYLRANGNVTLDPAAGRTLTAWVLVPAGAPGVRWAAQLEMQDAAYRWRPGPSTDLTAGRWAQISCSPDDETWAAGRGLGVQFSSDQAASVTAEVYLDSIQQQQGPTSPALSEALQWQRASQLVVNAIRANQDRTPVYVPGTGWSGAQSWPQNHPKPWVDDPADAVVYEAHYYFDRDNSGTYRYSFAEEDAEARARGHASLQARATAELGRFLGWCQSNAVRGFVGELGWDNRADTLRWNAVGNALYAAMDAAGVGAAYWAAGQWYGSSYNLSVYTGTPLSQRTAPAAVVEAHPSRNV